LILFFHISCALMEFKGTVPASESSLIDFDSQAQIGNSNHLLLMFKID
jgi:hypothetical protein